jgi:hypothetical protein
MAQQGLAGQGLLVIEASRWHSDTPQSEDSSRLVISLSPRPLPNSTQHLQDTYAPVGIKKYERPQYYALNRPVTGVGRILIYNNLKYF